MNTLKQVWSHLRGSGWFAPSLIVAFSIVVAVGLIEVDSIGSKDRMTVAGVTLSMILLTLAPASSRPTQSDQGIEP